MVNKNTLRYEGSALEKILEQKFDDPGRQDVISAFALTESEAEKGWNEWIGCYKSTMTRSFGTPSGSVSPQEASSRPDAPAMDRLNFFSFFFFFFFFFLLPLLFFVLLLLLLLFLLLLFLLLLLDTF